jgi:transcriptional regulator GlxA family with amidase domain
LLIPGGPGTRTGVKDPNFIAALRQAADKATWVASVCTGAMLLAETGFLNKRPATTNKEAFAEIAAAYPDVDWQPNARWVQYGHLFTASGVSAGMDMSLALLTAIDGRAAADEMARLCEYIWNDNPQDDPFSKP